MKKLISLLVCLVLTLTALCAFAEETVQDDPLHAHLANLAETPYTLATTEYDVMDPTQLDPEMFVELLNAMKIEKTDEEAPEGEYIVLTFPEENIRFDFFLAEGKEYLFRLVNADETEEMFKAIPPENAANINEVMAAWSDSLADFLGLAAPIEAELPAEGWIRDSIVGDTVWVDDRASLEIFLEDTDNFKVLISWASSASEGTEWTYRCDYSEEDQTLHAVHLIKENVVFDENEKESRETVLDVDVDTVFALNEEGKVVVTGAGDEQLEGKTFECVTDVQ
jgi:hypothetical protein